MTVEAQQTERAAFSRAWEGWHAAHERVLADPHGFLAVTSPRRLDATPTRFPDSPGVWSRANDGTVLIDSDRAACPLPPAQNRLPVPIEAGQQSPTTPKTTNRSVPAQEAAHRDHQH